MSAGKALAVVCYPIALAGAAAFAGLVLLLGLDLRPDGPSLPHPGVIDGAWLVVFGLQHSVMAREGWKRLWTRVVPAYLERSVYAALSGLLLAGMALTWQPLPGAPLWHGPPWLVVLPLAAALGMARVNLRFDHLGFFGIRQAWEQGRQPAPEPLLVVGPYRFVRHPLMACLLAFLWLQPVMPPGLLLLSGGLSAYIVLGVLLEERDLSRRFGPAYADYRRRVPMFLPGGDPWEIRMIPPDVRAVFFDAVGTLIHPEPPAAAVYAAVARSLGSRLTETEIASRFRTAFAREEAFDLTNGLRTSEERERRRWRHIVAEVLHDVGDGERCFLELFAHFARPDAWRCDPEAGEVLGELGRRGHVLGMASNYDSRLRAVAAGLPELRPLRHLVISSEVGWRKPAAEFFAALWERTGLGPREILFVGDDRVNDYEGATAAGLRAVLVGEDGMGGLRKLTA